jgi:AcrR family transcriptional regulator
MGRFNKRPMTATTELSKRERNLADIRDRAIPVAEQIVLDEGVEALSARRLAKEIGISVGSLYNAFGDLDAVVSAVISKSARLMSEVLRNAAETPADNRLQRVIGIGEAYLAFALENPMRWWLLFEFRPNMTLDERARDYQMGLLDMLIAVGQGNPQSERHRQFFLMLWASVHGLVSLACRPTIVAIEPEVARQYLSEMVISGFERFPTD